MARSLEDDYCEKGSARWDELFGADSHLEAAYEDANGSPYPEHLTREEMRDLWDEEHDEC